MEIPLITQARQSFGAELKRLRLQKRLTLHDLQHRSGINYAAISAMESGKRPAGDELAGKLADALMLDRQARSQFLEAASRTTLNSHQMHRAAELGSQIMSQAQNLGIVTDSLKLDRVRLSSVQGGHPTLACDISL